MIGKAFLIHLKEPKEVKSWNMKKSLVIPILLSGASDRNLPTKEKK